MTGLDGVLSAWTTEPGGQPRVFDVCGDLPRGTTVLEASAGTGKTFTVAALATRYVAEGVAELPELLLVTFGRAATSELRDRVRERLVSAERALRRPDACSSDDDLVRHLAGVPDDELGRRRHRLTRALAQFDAATIATTHGFCQQMLVSLGVLGDVDDDAVLVPDLADLADEVVDDLYLQRYASSTEPALTVKDARGVARKAMGDPQARLEPAAAAPDSLEGHRYAFARDAAAELVRRKRSRRLLDYDDLLVLLRDALVDREHGAAACERVRSRYRVVLVDEFQDTDPVQWQILRSAFHGHRTLVLIGDPKQAIYAFRGGDVVAYLTARDDADASATLGRSWRSDEPLLRGLDQLMRGAALGDDRIVVRPLEAQHHGRRMRGGAPLRLRHVTREPFGLKGSKNPRVGDTRRLVAQDVAADVVRQLQSARLLDGDAGWRPVRPGDVAVLTHRNADASAVRDALVEVGVPAVVSGLTSVFGTGAAKQWSTMLAALEQPGHTGRAAALALTPFVGWSAEQLASATDEQRDELADRVRQWASILEEHGVAALLETVSAEGLAARLLRTTTGERELTDLRHVGQALHVAAAEEGLGVAALSDWLRRRTAEADEDYAEERSRRLETDAAAVQVVTVHASKGLEFPVVYVPFAWDRYESKTPALLRFHDDDGTRILHVGGSGSAGYAEARDRHLAEERGEDLRLLYVALTRARSQVVLWWAPSSNSGAGALTRLLLGSHAEGEQPPARVTPPADDELAARFAAVADGERVVVEPVTSAPTPTRWRPERHAEPDLLVDRFTRHLDLVWRRTSYSGITAGVHEQPPGVASEPESAAVQDEPGAAVAIGPAVSPELGVGPAPGRQQLVPPLAAMPGGTSFGTVVHAVLERTDPTSADLEGELLRHCRDVVPELSGVDPGQLASALVPVLRTPLGPDAGDRALSDIATGDRLTELEFELPLAGGEQPTATGATVGDVVRLLRQHLGDDDLFAGYADHLEAAGLGASPLRGYLTGSLDAVLRLRGRDGEPCYVVADYKTNRLAPVGEPLTTWHYRRDALVDAMVHAHYPLQLLLYSVALHRFLRWRQPGYVPARHLGGALYLFVRGMCGPATPVADGVRSGVLAWRPPDALVQALSRLLDTGQVPA
ncbi:MAG TPA: UvrD-helicase domain-containing protein [Actinomycetales bacterium]|nr:UvrD-helicase domain-containing protein [Actinomycetales bacterium]